MSLKAFVESRAVLHEEDHRSPVRTQRNPAWRTLLSLPCPRRCLITVRGNPSLCTGGHTVYTQMHTFTHTTHMHTPCMHIHHTCTPHTAIIHTCTHVYQRRHAHTPHTDTHSGTLIHTCTSRHTIHPDIHHSYINAYVYTSCTGRHTLYTINTHSKIHRQADTQHTHLAHTHNHLFLLLKS